MKFVSRFLTERLLDIFKHCCQNISSKALWKSVSDNVLGRSKIQMTTKLNPNYTTISGWTPDTERLSCSALLQGLRYTGGSFNTSIADFQKACLRRNPATRTSVPSCSSHGSLKSMCNNKKEAHKNGITDGYHLAKSQFSK